MLSASYNDRVIPGKDAQLNELLEEIPPCANVPGQEDEDCENRNRMHQVCASYPGWQGRAVEGNVLLPIDRRIWSYSKQARVASIADVAFDQQLMLRSWRGRHI